MFAARLEPSSFAEQLCCRPHNKVMWCMTHIFCLVSCEVGFVFSEGWRNENSSDGILVIFACNLLDVQFPDDGKGKHDSDCASSNAQQ